MKRFQQLAPKGCAPAPVIIGGIGETFRTSENVRPERTQPHPFSRRDLHFAVPRGIDVLTPRGSRLMGARPSIAPTVPSAIDALFLRATCRTGVFAGTPAPPIPLDVILAMIQSFLIPQH
jgi:hypothetical protein